MAKTETNVSTLKINRGTYAKVQENLSSITENELIITSDKNVPIPTTNDNGKAVVVNASGEYELGNAGMSQSDADARYLKLAGGTMTGDIALGTNKLTEGGFGVFSASSGVQIGNSSLGTKIITSNSDIIHNKDGTNGNILDTHNTSANPTLSGGETTLSSLKLNGTNYAVGGTPKYLYNINITLHDSVGVEGGPKFLLKCNATLISTEDNLLTNGVVTTNNLLSKLFLYNTDTGYANIVNISNITLNATAADNTNFEPISYVRINHSNDHLFFQSPMQEIEIPYKTAFTLYIAGHKTQI